MLAVKRELTEPARLAPRDLKALVVTGLDYLCFRQRSVATAIVLYKEKATSIDGGAATDTVL